MVELAVDGVPDFVADDRELRRAPPSYTVDTLREFAAEQPGAELVLILGADAVARFSDWHEPAAIRGLATLAVAGRPGAAGGDAMRRAADAVVTMPLLEISSSAVRTRAVAGMSLAGWVPSAVADYIVASQVYVE
jgi:nicotinate-nucleotide adenylyltransferase